MVETLNQVLSIVSQALIRVSVQGGLIIFFIWLLVKSFPQISPRIQCWLWRLVLLKLIILGFWSAPIGIPLKPAIDHPEIVAPISFNVSIVDNTVTDDVIVSTGTRIQPGGNHPISWAYVNNLMMSGWILGCLTIIFRQFRELAASRRVLLSSIHTSDSKYAGVIQTLCDQLNIRRIPLMYISESTEVPLVVGVLEPKLIFPQKILLQASHHELLMMMGHELSHVKRKDIIWNQCMALAQVLLWFHPLVWVLRKQWVLTNEMACDELAIQSLSLNKGQYGNMILLMSTWSHNDNTHGLLTASIGSSKANLKRRIASMRHFKPHKKSNIIMTGIVIMLLSVSGILPWKLVAKETTGDQFAPPVRETQAEAQQQPIKDNVPNANIDQVTELQVPEAQQNDLPQIRFKSYLVFCSNSFHENEVIEKSRPVQSGWIYSGNFEDFQDLAYSQENLSYSKLADVTCFHNQEAHVLEGEDIKYVKDMDVSSEDLCLALDPVIGEVFEGYVVQIRPKVSDDLSQINLELYAEFTQVALQKAESRYAYVFDPNDLEPITGIREIPIWDKLFLNKNLSVGDRETLVMDLGRVMDIQSLLSKSKPHDHSKRRTLDKDRKTLFVMTCEKTWEIQEAAK